MGPRVPRLTVRGSGILIIHDMPTFGDDKIAVSTSHRSRSLFPVLPSPVFSVKASEYIWTGVE